MQIARVQMPGDFSKRPGMQACWHWPGEHSFAHPLNRTRHKHPSQDSPGAEDHEGDRQHWVGQLSLTQDPPRPGDQELVVAFPVFQMGESNLGIHAACPGPR